MQNKKLDQLISQLENYLECWKQFNHYLGLARTKKFESWGLENPENIAAWARQTMQTFRSLGESLNAGQLNQFEGLGPQRHVAIASSAGHELGVGFHRSLSQALVRETFKKILAKWVS